MVEVVNVKGCLCETLVCHGWPGTDRHGKLINTSPTLLVLLTPALVIPIPFPDQASALPTAGTTLNVAMPKLPLLPLAPFTMNNQPCPNAFPKLEPLSMSPTLPSLYSYPQFLTQPCFASVTLMTATAQHYSPLQQQSSWDQPTSLSLQVSGSLTMTCVYRTLYILYIIYWEYIYYTGQIAPRS